MINIKNHLSNFTANVDKLLDEKVEALWDHLNPIDKNNNPARNSTISRAKKFSALINLSSHGRKYGAEAAKRHRSFMEYLLSENKLKDIITASPSGFKNIIDDVENILTDEDYKEWTNKKTKHPSFSDLLINHIFKYANYRNTLFCSSLYISLNFVHATCPFCNEYPVKIIERKNRLGGKPTLHFDLDHFYPQHRYPYLALSFYNHIPSCKYCNSLHKGGKLFTVDSHIHPWERNFDEFYSFSYSHGALLGRKVDDVKIIKNSVFNDSLCSDLELEERYKTNIEYARINGLVSILADYGYFIEDNSACYGGDVNRLKERIADFGLVFSGNQILERPWSKMQRDLVKFFDVNNVLSLK